MIWLGIETANAPLSVAVVKDGAVVAEVVQNIKLTHSVGAMPAVEELLNKAGLKPTDIDAIAVSEGPGSYTGVRIGVTIAKTLAWTLQKPLVGVSSVKALAYNGQLFKGVVCALFDARRQHVYAGAYKNGEVVVEDGHMSIEMLLKQLNTIQEDVLFVGVDVAMYWDKIAANLGSRAKQAPLSFNLPRASQVIELAMHMSLPSIEETHHFVPTYKRIAEAEANWIKEQKQVDK
ncbi:MAG: tRNA (adenosine(37)-N6)-threonylcarbamoyltransferase complex dimerization subunit type 1 TsaB [Lysinibacillus sp.]